MSDGPLSWFEILRREVKRATGVILEPDRATFAASRLSGLARDMGFADAQQLCRALIGPRHAEVQGPIIDAMVVNETSFFRDRTPFEIFRAKVLPDLLAARSRARSLRIWCAACSTGQEAYSIAMTLDEEARALSGWSIEILAGDVSQTAIDVAKSGMYNQFQVQRGLSVAHLLRYFNRKQEMWTISEHLRTRVRFERMNVLERAFRPGEFDVIFCRNLMLYFDSTGRRTLLGRLSQALAQDGHLFVGATENASGEEFRADPHHPWLATQRKGETGGLQRPRLRLVGA
ncbi:MAG: CheR family methyltransferase [Beijerinckiaceae bacterium]